MKFMLFSPPPFFYLLLVTGIRNGSALTHIYMVNWLFQVLVWGMMHFPWWFPWAHLTLLLVVFSGWNEDTFGVVTDFSICTGQGEGPSACKSQNRSSRPTACPKQGQLEQVSQGQSGFECFQRLRLHNLFRQPLTTSIVWVFFVCLF